MYSLFALLLNNSNSVVLWKYIAKDKSLGGSKKKIFIDEWSYKPGKGHIIAQGE